MTDPQWSAVDAYLAGLLAPHDAALEAALAANRREGLPEIDVSPPVGKLLHLLARLRGARRILEIGTLGGYSTIWLARALPPGGVLLSLELEPRHAAVARANVDRAGLADRVEIRVGPAMASLAALRDEGREPFDLVFIDADKPRNPDYLEAVLPLVRTGSVIVGDNVVRAGAVVDAESQDPSVRGTRTFLAALASHPRLDATALQIVGSKGWDGVAIALVVA